MGESQIVQLCYYGQLADTKCKYPGTIELGTLGKPIDNLLIYCDIATLPSTLLDMGMLINEFQIPTYQ